MILRLFLVLRSQCNCLNFRGNNSFYNSIAQFCYWILLYFSHNAFYKGVDHFFFFFLIEILAKYQRGNAFKSY